jgi:LysR family hydrogen peroxide-inducible transcriptional activator
VQGELDLALVALPVAEEHLQAEALLTEPLLVAMPPGHPLTRRRKIQIRDLSAERFILLNEMHCLGEQALSLCRAHDCQPKIACRSAQIATVQALIALGHGISLLPEMARRADQSKRLVYRSLADEGSCRTIAAVWHRQSYHSPAAKCFLDSLRHEIHKLPASASPHKPR